MAERRRPAPCIRVGDAYDVVVGHGVLATASPALLGAGGASGCSSCHPTRAGGTGRSRGRDDAARRRLSACTTPRCPTPRRPRPPRSPPACGRSSARPAFTRIRRRRRRRRWHRHRPRRLRRGHVAARGARSSTSRRRCSPWSTRRSAARPASTPPRARTSSAPSTRRPACSATSTRWRRCPRPDFVAGLAEVVKAASSPTRVILDLVEADPGGGHRGATARTLRELVERAIARQGRRGRRRTSRSPGCARSSTTGTPSATRSSRSRATGGATARRSPSAWSTPPSSPGWPGTSARTSWTGTGRCSRRWGCRRPTRRAAGEQLLAAMRRDKKSRGAPAALRRPRGRRPPGAARGPRRRLAARRLHRHRHLSPRPADAQEVHRPSVLRGRLGSTAMLDR